MWILYPWTKLGDSQIHTTQKISHKPGKLIMLDFIRMIFEIKLNEIYPKNSERKYFAVLVIRKLLLS